MVHSGNAKKKQSHVRDVKKILKTHTHRQTNTHTRRHKPWSPPHIYGSPNSPTAQEVQQELKVLSTWPQNPQDPNPTGQHGMCPREKPRILGVGIWEVYGGCLLCVKQRFGVFFIGQKTSMWIHRPKILEQISVAVMSKLQKNGSLSWLYFYHLFSVLLESFTPLVLAYTLKMFANFLHL